MRTSAFNLLNLFFILILSTTHSFADGWEIDEMDKYVVLSKHGEVIHGDKLRFGLERSNCEDIHPFFSFLTTKGKGDIFQLERQKLPITLNEAELTAYVVLIKSFANNYGHWVIFSLGKYDLKKYSNLLHNYYLESEKYEITLRNGLNFEVKDYFDILKNNWKLENFNKNILKAYDICKNISSKS